MFAKFSLLNLLVKYYHFLCSGEKKYIFCCFLSKKSIGRWVEVWCVLLVGAGRAPRQVSGLHHLFRPKNWQKNLDFSEVTDRQWHQTDAQSDRAVKIVCPQCKLNSVWHYYVWWWAKSVGGVMHFFHVFLTFLRLSRSSVVCRPISSKNMAD